MIRTAQRYVIAGLLALVLANVAYSVYLSWKNSKTESQRVEAIRERDEAKEDTNRANARVESTTRALEAAQLELKAARDAIAARESRIEQINREKEAKDARLQNALDANRDWGSTPVPDSVRDALK